MSAIAQRVWSNTAMVKGTERAFSVCAGAQGDPALTVSLPRKMTHRHKNGGGGELDRRAAGLTVSGDLVCFSHLRWDFVFQRPQHLMTRFARRRRVLFVEEPLPGDGGPRMETLDRGAVTVARLRTPRDMDAPTAARLAQSVLPDFVRSWVSGAWIAWYYTPMALEFTRDLKPDVTVYDCMDELSAFAGAPRELLEREDELFSLADVVFAGGPSLYEAKRLRHDSVWPFPSSIDREHFKPARTLATTAPDQETIPRPRLGFFGVLDERFDVELLAEVARLGPDWHFVLIGPVVKIDPAVLPRAANIHYLGQRSYEELPSYIAGWDVALMPFAINAATRFISPTKTPEYLAAGRRVVSTPITDVVRMYGDRGLVSIAATPDEFVAAIEASLEERSAEADAAWLRSVDTQLDRMSWDRTWLGMEEAIELATGAAPSLLPAETLLPADLAVHTGPALRMREFSAADV